MPDVSNIIDVWIYPIHKNRSILFEKDNKIYLEEKWGASTGSISKYYVISVNDVKRFHPVADNSFGEFYVVKKDSIEIYDNDGYIESYPFLK